MQNWILSLKKSNFDLMKKELRITVIVMCVFATLIIVTLFHKSEKVRDYNCSDFNTYAEARLVFSKNKKDVYGLDRNHNGVPCENLIDK